MRYAIIVADFLTEINDSMELDSGQVVATLETNDLLIEIRVEGYVRVVFNNEVYKASSQFPKELLELFHNGKAYNDERVYIDDNNWFEVAIFTKNPDYNPNKKTESVKWLYDNRCDDVIDADWKDDADVVKTLMDYYKSFKEMLAEEK